MMELPTELKQRMDEAGKDGEWAEKVRNAKSWETYVTLLGEKGIELPAEVKDAFDADPVMLGTGGAGTPRPAGWRQVVQ